MFAILQTRTSGCSRRTPSTPTLHFKLLAGQRVYSARVGLQYRTLGLPTADGVQWFWIGTHADYDRLVGS